LTFERKKSTRKDTAKGEGTRDERNEESRFTVFDSLTKENIFNSLSAADRQERDRERERLSRERERINIDMTESRIINDMSKFARNNYCKERFTQSE